jgi:hypothetical protein
MTHRHLKYTERQMNELIYHSDEAIEREAEKRVQEWEKTQPSVKDIISAGLK